MKARSIEHLDRFKQSRASRVSSGGADPAFRFGWNEQDNLYAARQRRLQPPGDRRNEQRLGLDVDGGAGRSDRCLILLKDRSLALDHWIRFRVWRRRPSE